MEPQQRNEDRIDEGHRKLIVEAQVSVAAGRTIDEATMHQELDRWIAEDTGEAT